MNPRIHELIEAGESRTVEFKRARQGLSRALYQTVCAFLNRDGGDILLGVEDDGTVQGVDLDCVERMKQDFVTAINNPQKINPPCYLSLQKIEHAGAVLLHVSVPPSSQVHRCNGRIYDRNEDGDLDITDNQTLVTQLYVRKQSHYSENTIYPYATMGELRPELIARARKFAGTMQPNHPWLAMDDKELLISAQLWQRDYQRNEQGLTLAAILLFGKDTTILSVLPHHRTDAILRRDNVDRYDDRDDIRTNLLDSHTRLLAFGEKHLKDPFYLEGKQRVSLRGHILREIVGNLLIHREYSHAFPAKLVIEHGRLFTENSNRPHGHGPIDPRYFSPYPKNPVIARFFKEIGLADELGSGIRKLFKYGKAYGGHDPEMIEDDIFRFILPLSEDLKPVLEKTREETREETRVETPEQIIQMLKKSPKMTLSEVGAAIDKHPSTVERAVSKLMKEGRLKRVGPRKGGYWEVIS
jgi:ATP-dependent DNA helicase RecG